MRGAEHWKRADAMMAELEKEIVNRQEQAFDLAWINAACAFAHVHATLALAAATALGNENRLRTDAERQGWREVGAF
jgi:hypothetical protein